jgi:hypothetical protein
MCLRILALSVVLSVAAQAEFQVRVFVALCDNKTQGIQPVGAKIGDGDKPEANLYWGCDDGFYSVFKRSAAWKTLSSTKDDAGVIMRRLEMQHSSKQIHLVAEAYRGSEMRRCVTDFEGAAASHAADLVVFIGHNGLMDFTLPPPAKGPNPRPTEAVVLCCRSASYFSPRLLAAGVRPVLMTQQLMYPGSFLLRDALAVWSPGKPTAPLREAAAKAYAENQKISVKAAKSVFADLKSS